ncbi:MAG: rRNA maturation RNase YbeY [Clostridia bacterium]
MITFYNVERATKHLAKKIYKTTLKLFKQADIFELEVEVVSSDEMQKINREARNVDSVTDVLSFPSLEISCLPVTKGQFPEDINLETNRLMLGEIILCMDKITEQAEEFGHSLTREAGYLFLHGLLHLLGYDHIEEDDRVKMREKEEAVLEKLKITR